MGISKNNLDLQEELSEAHENLKMLREHYEGCLFEMKEEVDFLNEQISAQRNLLENAVNHVSLLEKEIRELKNRPI